MVRKQASGAQLHRAGDRAMDGACTLAPSSDGLIAGFRGDTDRRAAVSMWPAGETEITEEKAQKSKETLKITSVFITLCVETLFHLLLRNEQNTQTNVFCNRSASQYMGSQPGYAASQCCFTITSSSVSECLRRDATQPRLKSMRHHYSRRLKTACKFTRCYAALGYCALGV